MVILYCNFSVDSYALTKLKFLILESSVRTCNRNEEARKCLYLGCYYLKMTFHMCRQVKTTYNTVCKKKVVLVVPKS
jgi:hypothetical protein